MMNKPKVGDEIYVYSSYYISHGEDDFHGGLCKIKKVIIKDSDTILEYNKIFVEVEERPEIEINYTYLMENQKKWKKEFGNKRGEMCSD